MIQLSISYIIEDEVSWFEIILWCYQLYQNEIKDIDYLISIYMINLFVKIRYQKFEFQFRMNSFIFFKDKQLNYNNIFIKTKPMFKEVINDFDNLLRDDIYNTMKEVINMMFKEWICREINSIYNSIRLWM